MSIQNQISEIEAWFSFLDDKSNHRFTEKMGKRKLRSLLNQVAKEQREICAKEIKEKWIFENFHKSGKNCQQFVKHAPSPLDKETA